MIAGASFPLVECDQSAIRSKFEFEEQRSFEVQGRVAWQLADIAHDSGPK